MAALFRAGRGEAPLPALFGVNGGEVGEKDRGPIEQCKRMLLLAVEIVDDPDLGLEKLWCLDQRLLDQTASFLK